ncbi:MAG: SAM-dependent methyltransferase [Mariprofundaceae bacterium]|nr:SAM-dependent methyltransferase [Mariprofundaceae bacterium]
MLESMIKTSIESNQGMISFQSFMEKALYASGLGYYESSRVFGAQGDFITASDMGFWLARALSDYLAWSWQQLGQPQAWSVLEQGGGKGQLLCQVQQMLAQKEVIQPEYIAVERSQYLRQEQISLYQAHGLTVQQFAALEDVPKQACCVVFCNELLDAFPAASFQYQDGQFYEMGVSSSQDKLHWQRASEPLKAKPEIDENYIAAWPDTYQSEWNPSMKPWLKQLSDVFQQGFILCIDYGYTQAEYYRPQRQQGTLLAHYKHQTNEDFFQHIGQQDLTTHLDFSALSRYAQQQDLSVISFLSQSAWLAQSPSVQVRVGEIVNATTENEIQEKAHLQRLVHPFQMGEVFKVCVLAKNNDAETPEYLQQFQAIGKLA